MTQQAQHAKIDSPSDWVRRFAPSIPRDGPVLDLACGSGRHARYLAGIGYCVEAVDRDASAIASLGGVHGVRVLEADLENGAWPYKSRQFAGIVVTNYLHRPLFARLLDALRTGGVLIYETFAVGNERFGRPSNPDFLLQPGQLLKVTHGTLEVTAYEHLEVTSLKPAVVQRVCGIKLPLHGQ